MKISVLQYNIIWENADENIRSLIEKTENIGQCDLLLLPETFLSGFSNNVEKLALTMDSVQVNTLRGLARKKKCVIAGSLIIKDKGGVFNRFVFIFPNGQIEYYDKNHLFSMSNEDRYFSAGSERKVIDINAWKIFPQVCYDLRFPVFSRNNLGYDLAIYTANWPGVRDYVWQTLLKARAIENQCYVIGVNRSGSDSRGVSYVGHSMCVDPKGEVLAVADEQEQVLEFELNKQALDDFRQAFPVLNDRDEFKLM